MKTMHISHARVDGERMPSTLSRTLGVRPAGSGRAGHGRCHLVGLEATAQRPKELTRDLRLPGRNVSERRPPQSGKDCLRPKAEAVRPAEPSTDGADRQSELA